MATLTGAVRDRARPAACSGLFATHDGLADAAAGRRRRRRASGCGGCRSTTSTRTGSRATSPISTTSRASAAAGAIVAGALHARVHRRACRGRISTSRAPRSPSGSCRSGPRAPPAWAVRTLLTYLADAAALGDAGSMAGGVDLHSHTTASDGTLPPRELVRGGGAARRARARRHRPRLHRGPRRGDRRRRRRHRPLDDRARHRDQLRRGGRRDPRPRLLHGLRGALVPGLLPRPAARSAARACTAWPSGSPSSACRSTPSEVFALVQGGLGGAPARGPGDGRARLREDGARGLRPVPRRGQARRTSRARSSRPRTRCG